MNKRFSQELYDKFDNKAKKALVKLFDITPYDLRQSKNKVAVDFEIYKNDILIAYAECEVKNVWEGNFKYDSLQIPGRKKKYALLDKPTLFFVFDKPTKQVMIVDSKTLLNSPMKEVRNKYVVSREMFFQVPVDNVHLYDVDSDITKILDNL